MRGGISRTGGGRGYSVAWISSVPRRSSGAYDIAIGPSRRMRVHHAHTRRSSLLSFPEMACVGMSIPGIGGATA